jgi:hypothetical protein
MNGLGRRSERLPANDFDAELSVRLRLLIVRNVQELCSSRCEYIRFNIRTTVLPKSIKLSRVVQNLRYNHGNAIYTHRVPLRVAGSPKADRPAAHGH